MTINKTFNTRKSAQQFARRRGYGRDEYEVRATGEGWRIYLRPADKRPGAAVPPVAKDRSAVHAVVKAHRPEPAPAAKAEREVSDKGRLAVSLAARPEGVTSKELMDALGWSTAPWKWHFTKPEGGAWMPRLGYRLHTERRGREAIYKAVPAE